MFADYKQRGGFGGVKRHLWWREVVGSRNWSVTGIRSNSFFTLKPGGKALIMQTFYNKFRRTYRLWIPA